MILAIYSIIIFFYILFYIGFHIFIWYVTRASIAQLAARESHNLEVVSSILTRDI